MTQFDPTTWIDQQRADGMARGNVFTDILAAAKSIRNGQTKKSDYRVERRIAEVHQIRRDAAQHDRQIDEGAPKVPSFSSMVARW